MKSKTVLRIAALALLLYVYHDMQNCHLRIHVTHHLDLPVKKIITKPSSP